MKVCSEPESELEAQPFRQAQVPRRPDQREDFERFDLAAGSKSEDRIKAATEATATYFSADRNQWIDRRCSPCSTAGATQLNPPAIGRTLDSDDGLSNGLVFREHPIEEPS